MKLDIRGKVNEKKLATVHTLLPLFEAVVNSIHAIEEGSSTKPGLIEIELIRSDQTILKLEENEKPPIETIKITDNGIGFNQRNFTSFEFAHSTYKEIRGGKGIGRFTWLKAFQRALIESNFQDENGKWFSRTFSFEMTPNGIEGLQTKEAKSSLNRWTSVTLCNMKPEYQKWCNQDPEDIALKIIEHCFPFFLNPNAPRIKLKDGDIEFFVNDRFNVFTKGKVIDREFEIGENDFNLMFVRLYGGKPDNRVHYCADTREVESERLSNYIPELDSYLHDASGQPYSIGVYVMGKYFDNNVSEDRTAIYFGKDRKDNPELEINESITKNEITEKIVKIIEAELNGEIDYLSKARLEAVETFINERPRYRKLLKYKRESIRRIQSGLSKEKLEVELFKIEQELELEVKEETSQAIKEIEEGTSLLDFQTKHPELYSKIMDVGAAKLSDYILHRKIVLDLFESHLNMTKDGKFVKEDVIHSLIFPLKTFSADVGYDEHNLWMIDERLSYHKYLASDVPFKEITAIEVESKDRPDLLILNKSFAFTDSDKPYPSIVLIEFKRPMRDDYSDKENPIAQVIRYADKIITGKMTDKNGRPFDLKDGTKIYAYIICDLTPNMHAFAKAFGFTPAIDNDGYFHFNNNYNLYTEVISFDKLLQDAKRRNKILFDKLGIV